MSNLDFDEVMLQKYLQGASNPQWPPEGPGLPIRRGVSQKWRDRSTVARCAQPPFQIIE